jgi:hypothetical protein
MIFHHPAMFSPFLERVFQKTCRQHNCCRVQSQFLQGITVLHDLSKYDNYSALLELKAYLNYIP